MLPLGSTQSRAAARAMLEARRANEGGVQFVSVSIVDGTVVNFGGLVESIRAARKVVAVAHRRRGSLGQLRKAGQKWRMQRVRTG